MDWTLLILLLICPLMMLFMHRGHNHGNQKEHKHGNENNEHHNHPVDKIESYKLKKLEGEIQYLKEQNDMLQKKIEAFNEDVRINK